MYSSSSEGTRISAPIGNAIRKAAVVDHLGLTQPDQAFMDDATQLLEKSGYRVDYYPPEQVTVDFYRHLPEHGYDLLVLRTHSTAVISRGGEDVKSISLFSNEPYSRDRYYDEQVAGRIGFAQYTDQSPMLFGITADFITKSMVGRFHDTVVLIMGCQGLVNDKAAQAFEEKGARTYFGWDGLVSAAYTDRATKALLRHLVVESSTPQDAVARTMDEVGPDPDNGSQLRVVGPQP